MAMYLRRLYTLLIDCKTLILLPLNILFHTLLQWQLSTFSIDIVWSINDNIRLKISDGKLSRIHQFEQILIQFYSMHQNSHIYFEKDIFSSIADRHSNYIDIAAYASYQQVYIKTDSYYKHEIWMPGKSGVS